MLPRLRGRFLIRWIPAFAGMTQFSRGTMIFPSSRGPQGSTRTASTVKCREQWFYRHREARRAVAIQRSLIPLALVPSGYSGLLPAARVYALWVLVVAMTKNE